jgi:hypothetical protein
MMVLRCSGVNPESCILFAEYQRGFTDNIEKSEPVQAE